MPAGKRAAAGEDFQRRTGEAPILPSTPAQPSKAGKVRTVPAVKLSTLLKLWEKWREAGNDSFARVSEAQIQALWCSVARGIPHWDDVEVTKCLVAVRRMLQRDSTLISTVLEDGNISSRFDRFLHYILLERASTSARKVLDSLWRMLEGRGAAWKGSAVDPETLQRLHLALAAKDIDRCNRWRMAELLRIYYEVLCLDEAPAGNPDSARAAESFVKDALPLLGISGDEALTYPEFLSLLLGRVESDVILYMYDLSAGAAKTVKLTEGIWHTSVHVFGWEYLYSGRCVYVEPGESCFGAPTRKLQLGSTLARRSELHSLVVEELADKFTVEHYDVMKNNCNHFSDKILYFLCGVNVPDEIMHQTDRLMQLPGVEKLYPLLTNWVTSLIPNQRINDVVARESTSDDTGKPKDQQGSSPPQDESSTTAATESGERSTSFGDGDSLAERKGPAGPGCGGISEEIGLLSDPTIQDIEALSSISLKEDVEDPPRRCCFINPLAMLLNGKRKIRQGVEREVRGFGDPIPDERVVLGARVKACGSKECPEPPTDPTPLEPIRSTQCRVLAETNAEARLQPSRQSSPGQSMFVEGPEPENKPEII